MIMRKIDENTIRMSAELQQVIADYWDDVDFNRGLGAPEFYTEDCVFWVGSDRNFEGRAGIAEFYRYRTDRGTRTTSHATANFRVIPDGNDRATVTYIVANYASDGSPPITGLTGPSLVSKVEAECIKDADGYWRFKTVRGTPLFIGGEPYTISVLIDKQH
jgi:ketosteroid isomerase-like protein